MGVRGPFLLLEVHVSLHNICMACGMVTPAIFNTLPRSMGPESKVAAFMGIVEIEHKEEEIEKCHEGKEDRES
jgi:hypothetical protein